MIYACVQDYCLLGCDTIDSEDGGSRFLQNVGTYLPNYKCHSPEDCTLRVHCCETSNLAYTWIIYKFYIGYFMNVVFNPTKYGLKFKENLFPRYLNQKILCTV
jgi:hypothetical protein